MESLETNNFVDHYLAVKSYAIYIPVVIAMTIFVARNLFKSGKIFMNDIFNGREEIASATNKLFEVGFYLFNVGMALLILKIGKTLYTAQEAVEVLSFKIGGFSIFLGIMLFFNLFLFFRGKNISKKRNEANRPIPTFTQP